MDAAIVTVNGGQERTRRAAAFDRFPSASALSYDGGISLGGMDHAKQNACGCLCPVVPPEPQLSSHAKRDALGRRRAAFRVCGRTSAASAPLHGEITLAATQEALDEALQPFINEGMISGVVTMLKTGKEATAYLCRARPALGAKYAVAKVYHESTRRNFRHAEAYNEGRLILNGQVRRAVAAHTEFGRQAAEGIWVDREFEHLSALADSGADVPEPYACEGSVLLMEYFGTGETPAPQLQTVLVEPDRAGALLDRVLWNVERFLSVHLVHADLSPFNILVHEGRPVVIDLPQAVDARFNRQARDLLERDLRNVCRYFARFGIERDASREASRLWERYRFGALG